MDVESLVKGRSKRSKAGNRMARLLEQDADDDDFYTEHYGDKVFHESDSDFTSEGEDEDDYFDSDFESGPEEDETVSGNAVEDEVEEEMKKKRNVYIDPAAKKQPKRGRGRQKSAKRTSSSSTTTSTVTRPRRSSTTSATSGVNKVYPKRQLNNLKSSSGFVNKIEILPDATGSRKSSRSRLINLRKEREKQKQQEEEAKKKPHVLSKKRKKGQKLTLSMRLIQAVETEKLNASSLYDFQLSAAQKKRSRTRTRTLTGQRIRFRSYTTIDSNGNKTASNVISFSDEDAYNTVFRPHTPVDTRPHIELVKELPPPLPITEHDAMKKELEEGDNSNANLFPNFVSPKMNIFNQLGFAK
eukprot:m.115701 g.115701  ORF g.115701 m.115701 type:complete len:356 (+) comp12843_c0_seq2:146-1213(+)